jgi:hypothetical protein
LRRIATATVGIRRRFEVPTAAAVAAAAARLREEGLDTTGTAETACCFAAKTETWLEAPDGQRWEWYVKHEDLAGFASDDATGEHAPACCT